MTSKRQWGKPHYKHNSLPNVSRNGSKKDTASADKVSLSNYVLSDYCAWAIKFYPGIRS